MDVIRVMERGHPKCGQVRTGREMYLASFVRRHLHSLIMFLSYGVLFYLQKFNLNFIKKGCVCQTWLSFSNEIKFCCNEISSFYFELFFRSYPKRFYFYSNRILGYFSVTSYFEKILCIVARRFI